MTDCDNDLRPTLFSDIIDIAGTQRQEELGHINDETENYVPEYDEDTDFEDELLTDEKPADNIEESSTYVDPATKTGVSVKDKTINTRPVAKLGTSGNTKKRNTVVREIKSGKFVTETDEHELKVTVNHGKAVVKRAIKKEVRSPLKRIKVKKDLSSVTKTDETNQGNHNTQKVDVTKSSSAQVQRTFNCRRCNEPFPSTVAHNKHLRSKVCFIKNSYDEQMKYVPCKQCNLTFPRQDYLDVHRAVHEESVPRNFDVTFTDLSKQLFDIEREENMSKLKCQHCGQNFTEKRLLLHHTIITHGMSFECTLCEEQCETKHKCWPHQRSHENQTFKSVRKTNFHCKSCTMTFKSKSDMDKHDLIFHTDGPVASFPCDQCKKVFSSETFLEKHKVNVHGKKLKCPHDGCQKGFSTLERLEQHSAVHGEKSFMCSICGKLFNNRGNFQVHLSVHESERRFECDVCKSTFKTKDVLSKHKRIHADTRPFCCEICGWGFNQSGSLKKHMESHLNIKRHQCDVCNQKFANKSSLTNHKLLRNHFAAGDGNDTAEIVKAKKCEYCDKLFPPGSMYMYKRHVVIHTGVKPYTCDFCGKSFSDKSNLKYHRLIHLENKPFSCPVCGRGFIQKRGLRKHLESSTSCSMSISKASKNTRDDESEIDTAVSTIHRPTTVVEISGNSEMETGPSASADDIQREVPMHFQESYSAEAIEAAMALAGTEQGPEIPRNVIDLPGSFSSGETTWMYVKQ